MRDRRRFVRLLETFPGLVDDLDPEAARALNRDFVSPVALIPTGRVMQSDVLMADVRGTVSAAIVVEGLIGARWPGGTRNVLQLYGPGEFIDLEFVFADDSPAVELIARTPVSLALLDDRLGPAVQRHPSLAAALVRWGASQLTLAEAYAAVMRMTRVEDRVLAMLESFAVRWGRVTPRGVEVSLDLSHSELGELVGAARSTVSIGVQALIDAGLVIYAAPDRWTLTGLNVEVLPESHHGTLPVRAAVSVLRDRIQG